MTAALLTVFCTGILLIYAYLTLITVPNQSENAFQTQSIYTKFPPRQILAENQNPEKLNSPAQTSKRKPPDLLKTRGRTVRQKCYAENRRHGIHLNRTINRQDLVWQMIIEPKSEIFGCVPLRSSSGTWNRFWYQIRGHSTHEEFNFEQRKELTTVVQNFSIKQIRDTINTGYKFLVVRHPIARFFSAYHLKFKNRKKRHVPITGDELLLTSGVPRNYLDRYHSVSPNSSETGNTAKRRYSISKIDLINAIYDFPDTFNTHFKPQVVQCEVCRFLYDYIIRVEDMKSDASSFLDLVGITDAGIRDSLIVGRNRGVEDDSEALTVKNDKMMSEFMEMPEEVKIKFFEVYKDDFELFGYDKFSVGYKE